MNIKDCVEKRFLLEEKPDENIINKEITESEYDFESAQKVFEDEDYKWTIVQSYYAMFHAVKAVCFALGYREKKHFALLIILEELNRKGKLEQEFVNYFNVAMDSRERADYQYNYSEEGAKQSLERAASFNKRMKELIKEL